MDQIFNKHQQLCFTYRQKLCEADAVVPVAVQFLQNLSDHVSWLGVAGLFKKLTELIIGNESVVIQIWRGKKTE